ncbi:uncharacterized protein LOC134815779 [Bolinopsis microptera]|uniref:uncharacterized protein LOC134815779 n=1 Tax=Bolinopsis microptera TaxID=2820187 RepID=UPI003078FD01
MSGRGRLFATKAPVARATSKLPRCSPNAGPTITPARSTSKLPRIPPNNRARNTGNTGNTGNTSLRHARSQILSDQRRYNRNSTPRVLQGFNQSKPKTMEELRQARLKKFDNNNTE